MTTKHVVLIICFLIYGCVLGIRSSLQPLTNVFEKPPFLMDKSQITSMITMFYVGFGIFQIPAGLSLQILSSEITLIVPVLLSGIWAEIQLHCQSYYQCMTMRFLIGASQASCILSIMCIIQQNFSLKQFSFYSGLLMLIGNLATSFNILQTHLLVHHQIYKLPILILALSMQFLCITLLIIYCLDRKRIIGEIKKWRNRKRKTISESTETCTETTTEYSEIIESETTSPSSSWKLWFIPRDQLIELKTSSSIDNEHVPNEHVPESSTISIHSHSDSSNSSPSYRQRAISALTNKSTYLFAAVYGLLCITPVLLGSMWLVTYLTTKWPESGDNQLVITEVDGQIINLMTPIGAGMGSLLFGWISRRFHDRNPLIHRQLTCAGFVLQGSILMVVYIPSAFYSYGGLLLNAFVHGMGSGAIPILFAGTREANVATKSSDVASAIVGSICVGLISLSGFVFGEILKIVQGQKVSANYKMTESEFNRAFLFVVGVISVGLSMTVLIPKIKRK